MKLADGEISLQGFSTERANEFEALLSGVSSTKRGPATEPLNGIAVGYVLNKETKTYDVAIVHFNPQTKEAAVSEVKNVGIGRDFAIAEFKVWAYEKGLI